MEYRENAYEEYRRQLGNYDRHGIWMPEWKELHPPQKDIWRAVAHAVFRKGWQEKLLSAAS